MPLCNKRIWLEIPNESADPVPAAGRELSLCPKDVYCPSTSHLAVLSCNLVLKPFFILVRLALVENIFRHAHIAQSDEQNWMLLAGRLPDRSASFQTLPL